ncbi:hypothetical protein TGARI_212045 [Toxoplasma gondii ARI]|uniref:Transmembrane protein n=1 Tax=Toxoplasma gondii ARI TaxID=1074872 RepID=A0A139XU65_TOXGO|nr:hypothetical protein TGARI_212045 [Toxoplasma gondii ARI]
MADWQLIAFVSFSVAGVLLVVLVVVTVVLLRRRRCNRMNYCDKVLELKENLKAAHAAKEAKEEEFTSLRRSVADFDAERSLLLKRLESCGTNSTPEEIRRCLRELQLYLAFQSANSSCLRKAVNSDCTKGPPALLAEVWLVHGQIYTARDDDSYPSLDDFPPPFSHTRRLAYGRKRSNIRITECSASNEEKPLAGAAGVSTVGPFPGGETHCAGPPSRWCRPRHRRDCCSILDPREGQASTSSHANTFFVDSRAAGCSGEETTVTTETCPNPTETGGCQASCSRSATETVTCGETHGEGQTLLKSNAVEACTIEGFNPPETSVLVEGATLRAGCCPGNKACCPTAVIPAHTFAPEYIFIGEQWLPGPYETAKNCFHDIPLVRLAKFSRPDHVKTDSFKTDVYQHVLPYAHRLENVLLSSEHTSSLDLGSCSRDHIKLQSRALVGILPSLHVSTKAVSFPHLRYSLVEYNIERLTCISRRAMRYYIGETLNQPLYIIVRVFERNSVPGATPPASPDNEQTDELVSEKEQESWTLVYEAPPVCLTELEGRVMDDEVITFDDDSHFHYKHPYTPPPPTLFQAQVAGQHEQPADYTSCHLPVVSPRASTAPYAGFDSVAKD